jgi:uroporphyrinogen-III synthase
MRLLITRPEPDNARTAATLRARGHDMMLAPMLRIEPIVGADLGAPPWSAILLTSANGARAIAIHPRRHELAALPVLAVGGGSAEAAREAGFADVTSADGDARDLVRLASARFSGVRTPLLYLAGEHRAADVAGVLSKHGLAVRTVEVYRAIPVTSFPPAVRAALEAGTVDGVLHFSRRSAESYLACGKDIAAASLAPVHYCLSGRTAEPLQRAGAGRVDVASHPDERGLLALVPARAAQSQDAMPKSRSNRLE